MNLGFYTSITIFIYSLLKNGYNFVPQLLVMVYQHSCIIIQQSLAVWVKTNPSEMQLTSSSTWAFLFEQLVSLLVVERVSSDCIPFCLKSVALSGSVTYSFVRCWLDYTSLSFRSSWCDQFVHILGGGRRIIEASCLVGVSGIVTASFHQEY